MSKPEEKPRFVQVSGQFKEYMDHLRGVHPNKTDEQLLEEAFGYGFFILEEDIPSGQVAIRQFVDTLTMLKPLLAGEKPAESRKAINQYRELATKFFATYAGKEWARAFIGGGGFQVIVDDPENKIMIRNRNEVNRLNADVYQDYYTRGLDKITSIMLSPALVDGASAAEIVYETEMKVDDYITLTTERDETNKQILVKAEKGDIKWTKHKGIERLKIIEDAIFRLTPKRDPTSYEIMFWVVDEEENQSPEQWIKLLPEQVFWLSPNREGHELIGPSIMASVASIAYLLDGILSAIGINFQRWGNKRYFFIMGTPERPWSPPAVKSFLTDTKTMVDKNKMGIPVPAGFDYKSIGGEIFEGTDVINYFFSAIATGMLFPRDFMETGRTQASDKNWRAWLVRIGRLQRQVKRDIEQQLWEPHLWCKYGKTYRIPKKGTPIEKQEQPKQYVPKPVGKQRGVGIFKRKLKC